MIYPRPFFCLTLIAGLVVLQTTADARMFRWVDEDGRIFYSDKVPPKQSRHERKVLSDTGRVLDTVKAAKTKEQIALEERLAILREEQKKIIAKQESYDKVLLSTFRTLDDLKMTLNGKFLALDAQKRIFERALDNLRGSLASEHRKAANAERSGYHVPKNVLKEIANIEEKISVTYLDIAKLLEKRAVIQKKFEKDIERFSFLTNQKIAKTQKTSKEPEVENALGLFNCKDELICNQAWEIARKYVSLNSTTKIYFNAEKLIMTGDPMVASDISLSVSKLRRGEGKASIFLDIRCHKSNIGSELCESNRVEKIRASFKPYIEKHL